MNVSMEQNPSKYLHFKSARVHQENGWRNTNEERREMRPDAVAAGGTKAAVKSEVILDTFFFPSRLVGPDLCGSVFEGIYMNHPSTSLRNESPACLLTL